MDPVLLFLLIKAVSGKEPASCPAEVTSPLDHTNQGLPGALELSGCFMMLCKTAIRNSLETFLLRVSRKTSECCQRMREAKTVTSQGFASVSVWETGAVIAWLSMKMLKGSCLPG